MALLFFRVVPGLTDLETAKYCAFMTNNKRTYRRAPIPTLLRISYVELRNKTASQSGLLFTFLKRVYHEMQSPGFYVLEKI